MLQESLDQDRIARHRIKQVFDYLKALNERRNPAVRTVKEQPWHIWLDRLPSNPSIEFRQRVPRGTSEEDEAEGDDRSILLRVRRPQMTEPPPPPDHIRDWLHPGWDDPNKNVELLKTRNLNNGQGETITATLEDDPVRLAAFKQWLSYREKWRGAELPARASMDVFNALYALHGKLEREAERFDLVLGDGILSWQRQEGSVYHPVILQRVELRFESSVPQFCIIDADVPSELSTLIESMPDVAAQMVSSCRAELGAQGFHPLDEDTSGYLQALVNRLSPQGTFHGNQRPPNSATEPVIGRAPVLFLRSRTKGFGTAIEQVINSVENRDDFCDALLNIVGCNLMPLPRIGTGDEVKGLVTERPSRDVLFGKPVNPEQLRIARELDRHGAVLVQGPPGTGKSHTIANLIGHLLAHGKSVLVTSHTTKALRVLRGHVVDELRPLSVSVLDSDMDSRQELEESVQAISRRLSESDAEELEKEATALEQKRLRLIHELERLQSELQKACADEYRDVVVDGSGILPAEAARFVASGKSSDNWIPAPAAPGEPCPLSMAEVRELYGTNASTRLDDDRYVDYLLPEIFDLLEPQEVERAIHQSADLAESAQFESRYWPAVTFTTNHIQSLSGLIAELRSAVNDFATVEGWKLAALDAGRNPRQGRNPWLSLLVRIEETEKLAVESEEQLIVHRPEVEEQSPLRAQILVAGEVINHLARGGRLGWITLSVHSAWRKALSGWRVHGRQAQTVDEVSAIKRLLALKIAREELGVLWDGLMAFIGAPAASQLGEEPERGARQFARMIREALDWWPKRWLPLEERLKGLGFDWELFIGEQDPDLSKYGETRRVINSARLRLIGVLEATQKHLRWLLLRRQKKELLERLGKFNRPEAQALRAAISSKDPNAYAQAHAECVAAFGRRTLALRRKELLSRLTRLSGAGIPIAESWASAISAREGVHGAPAPPGNVLDAWRWRQLSDELCKRAQVDVEQIGRRIAELQDKVKRVTNELIDRKAWAGQLRRTNLAQRQALMGWLGIIKRIGKGHGRRVPQLRREAQQKMSECRESVPVWIMPISRLVENYDFSAAKFDVVIIDEASQCDVMSMVALAIARRVIVVGDDKQVSPTAIGQNVDDVDRLIRVHLDGIPNATLYDGRRSMYDLARESFPGFVCLLEHFRCVPDIINFSNHLCYGDIKPLRERASSKFTPHVVPYRVESTARREGKVNSEEALVVASLLVAISEHEAYKGQRLGVISLLGEDQAIAIERLARKHMNPEEYEKRRIICGNSAQFQGDERDIMFLSMVDAPRGGPLPMLDRLEFQQRYNVAASRARNQMWLVYSLSHETDLKPGDLRRRLIEHAIDPGLIARQLKEADPKMESVFEQQVCERLVRKGYVVRPQWEVGRCRIDLVVEDGDSRLAIECDGDRYHPIEKISEDLQRQAILERLGWRFIRLRGSVFYRDPERTMESVFRELGERGIYPSGAQSNPASCPDESQTGLVDEIIGRAAELRALWENSASGDEEETSEDAGDETDLATSQLAR